MNKNLKEFMELLHNQVGKGIYVWGSDGEDLTAMKNPEAWVERKSTTATCAKQANAMYRDLRKKGVEPIRAFDCSGLVYWCLNKLGLQKSDVSSRGLYRLCREIKKTELREGDFVFHHNGTKIVHVGVYAGQGLYIECRGTQYGVVLNKTHYAGYWNRFGRWKDFESDATEVYVKAGSVNVREGDNKKTKLIGIAHKGDKFPLLGIAPSGWYNIDYKGQNGYISNRADLTEVR